MGTHVIKMPDIGEGIAEVEVVAWHAQSFSESSRQGLEHAVQTDVNSRIETNEQRRSMKARMSKAPSP